MSQTDDLAGTYRSAPLSIWRIAAVAASASACLAVLTASQTYVTMLSHGHSFARLLTWQLGCWGFWAIVAPWIVRLSGRVSMRRLVGIGAALTATHTLLVAQLAEWLQPFVPGISYDFGAGLTHLGWFFAFVDPLVVGLLIVCGRGVAAYERARQFQLRESQLEAELARAQLAALRLVIQPHFLFNTLNSLAALIRSQDNSAALSMLLSLSDMMRDTLDGAERQTAPLGRELKLIRKYVELQRARFGERLRVRFQIDPAAERCEIPVLLLQPLVENAIRHGIAPRAGGGQVVIGASVESPELLRLWVSDDGVGVHTGFDVTKDAGTGLGNTRARLERLYDSRGDLSLRTAPGGGTIVDIVMPATGAGGARIVESGAA